MQGSSDYWPEAGMLEYFVWHAKKTWLVAHRDAALRQAEYFEFYQKECLGHLVTLINAEKGKDSLLAGDLSRKK